MNRKQMEYFIEVYRCGNIQTAADHLYVARQGLSRAMRSLEEELGQPLFTRTPRGIIPTDYAAALLPHVQRMLDEYQSIESMKSLATHSKSVVTIFALDHVFSYLGAQFLQDFHAAHPSIILSIVDTTDDDAMEGLLTKRCHFAIVTAPFDQTRFQGDALFFSRYCARLSAHHPLAEKSRITYTDLDGQMIISKGRAYQCFRHNIDKHILLPGLKIEILAETADESLIVDLLRHNPAINLGYDYAAVMNRQPDIVMRELGDGKDTGQVVCLIQDKTVILTEAARTFRQFLLDWLKKTRKDRIIW